MLEGQKEYWKKKDFGELHSRLQKAKGELRSAFEEMVRIFQDDIYRYCSYRLGPDRAEDVAQETFAGAWKGLLTARFEHEKSIPAWLFGIAKNKVRDEIEENAKRKKTLDSIKKEGCRMGQQGPAYSTFDLKRVLLKLNKEERLSVILMQVVRFSAKDTAELLGDGVGEGGVRTRVSRALAKLKEEESNNG